MNQDRAKAAEAALKNVETLKKSFTKSNSAKAKTIAAPTGPTKIQASGLPEPVAGTGFVQYIMYFIGGVLLLGVVLMFVDRWFFPIFKRAPGAPGYISLPGTDESDKFWVDLTNINDVTIGSAPTTSTSSTSSTPPNPPPLYSSLLASQSTYSITLDVLINDEKPQDLGSTASNNILRTFFFLGSGLENNNRKITFTMDNNMNRVHINVFSNSKASPYSQIIQSCVIDNVPIHKPFRVGLVKTSYAMEAYLNGLLVKTVQLQGQQNDPNMGDIIYAPQNILSPPSATETTARATVTARQTAVNTAKTQSDTATAASVAAVGTATAASTATEAAVKQKALADAQAALTAAQTALATARAGGKVLSAGIQVMNLTLLPYAVMPNEMQARMSNLTDVKSFHPKNADSSSVNGVSDWWNSLF
jgi:hypothetical protein